MTGDKSPAPARLFSGDPPVWRVGRERLAGLLGARSIALVGASENSPWSHMTYGNFESWGFDGRLHLVSRRGAPAHGRATATSCVAIGEPIDVAILMVSNVATPDALRDAAAAGARGAVVLGAGFSESGEEGREAQRQLSQLALELDLTLFGPNGVGFINLLDRVPAWVSPLPRRYVPGRIAVVSHSGNLGLTIADFAAAHNTGLSHVVSTGNEVNLDILDVLDCLLEDERVRVLAVFAESIRDPQFFLEIAARAAELEKPIVMLKAGASPLAARVAQTHTGALVGNDDVIDAALREAGVIRVRSLEELVLTAGLVDHTGPLPPGGLGVVSISGGSNDIIADRAEALGVPLPALSEGTRERLGASLEQLGIATLMNPFDVTGAAIGNLELLVEPLRAIGDDPGIALVAYTGVPFLESAPMVETYPWIARGLEGSGVHGVLLTNTLQPVTAEAEATLRNAGIPFTLLGLEAGLVAIRNLFWWSGRLRRPVRSAAPGIPVELRAGTQRGTWSEAQSLELFAEHGVPAVPWRLAESAAAAVQAARSLGYPVVLKISSSEVIHKSDIGGVVLDVQSDADVEAAFDRLTHLGTAAGNGVIVAAMRRGGLELVVGVTRDDQWGLTLAVGFGGVLVEAIGDTSLRLLPVDELDVREMLGELRGSALLGGVRGGRAADLDRLAEAIVAFSRLAATLGPRLESMEINPLRVDGSVVEALDAVVAWRD